MLASLIGLPVIKLRANESPENKNPPSERGRENPRYHLGWRSAPTYPNAALPDCGMGTFISALSGGPGCVYWAMRSRFGQRLGRDGLRGVDDPAHNIPDLLGDA